MMTISEQEDRQLVEKLKTINTVQIQSFISEFHNANASEKTLHYIEENFIKKYRNKNSLIQNTHDSQSSTTEFINGLKETIKFYQAYHQCKSHVNQVIQITLDKYSFTKDLKMFTTQLYNSQTRAINFFLTQIQFRRVFIAQNEAKYHKKVENLNEICSSCKQNMTRKSFQNIKQEVGSNFTDPYQLYDKGKLAKLHGSNHFSTHFDLSKPFQRIDELQEADMRMRQLIKESKRIDFSKLDEIYEHFDTKQEAEMYSLNKGKVNEMFYDLQTKLNNQSSQLLQYMDQLVGFNDKLVNYNPGSGVKVLQRQEKDQTEPKYIETQLKYNMGKIIKKIYNKITEIREKQKQEVIDQEIQVNLNKQPELLKEMDKQKKKIQFELRQSKEEKKFLTTSFKSQSQDLRKQIQRLSVENNKIDISRQEIMLEKNNMQRTEEKLIKMINYLKKQNQRLNSAVERKQYLASKKQQLMSANKPLQETNVEKMTQEFRGKERSGMRDGTSNKKISKKHLYGVSKIQHNESQSSLVPSSDQTKSPQLELLQELQRHERELINNLAKKKLKINKKKYLLPKRSKIIDTITLEDSYLKKQVNLFSQERLKELEELNYENEYQNEDNAVEDQESDDDQINKQFPSVDNIINQGVINQIDEQNEKQTQQQDENSPQKFLKNVKSKTFNKVKQRQSESSDERGHSTRQIEETEEEIKQKLEELRKMKKMKEIQMKIANIQAKNLHGLLIINRGKFLQKSANGFQIEKQVQQKIMAPKINKSVDNTKSLTKKSVPHREVHHQSLYKNEILKKFGKSSQNLQNSQIQTKPNRSHLQLPQNRQNLKSSNQQNRNSSVSILASRNLLSFCEQVEKHFEENKNYVGTQTSFSCDELLRMLYKFELQWRNWNEILVPFDCFKFGYEEFINQLCQLIAKQQRNPIRKLNGFKGSADVLKKPHNYRFNQENFYNSNGQKEVETINLSEQDMKMKIIHSKNEEKNYFIPRFSTPFSKGSEDSKLNQTTAGSFFRQHKNQSDDYDHQIFPQKSLQSSMSLADLKNSQKSFKTFDSSTLLHETNNGNLKKKAYLTLHQMKSEGSPRQIINGLQEKGKLPIINQAGDTFKIPDFEKEDAQNLFFTIESAKTIEENIKNNNLSKNQASFVTLENQQIRFSTQLLAILAHIHLLEPNSYNQIKNILLHPAKVFAKNRSDLDLNHQPQNENHQDSGTQISLKKGLGYVIQLHRKCTTSNGDQGKQRLKTRQNFRLSQNSLMAKNKNVCQHLISFRKKIGDVIKAHQSLKNKLLVKQNS